MQSTDRLEEIDRKTYQLKNELHELAQRVWDKWLTILPEAVSQIDRRDLSSFLATLRLNLGAVNESDTTYNPELYRIIEKIRTRMAKYLPCWAVTSLSANRRIPLQKAIYDLLIIDEASQCDIASVLPLLYRAKSAVIIGDPKQLSHITSIGSKQDASLLTKYKVPMCWSYKAISLFDYACSIVNPDNITDLLDHYRSHEDIIGFSNDEFYGGRLRIATKYRDFILPAKESPGVRWIDVTGKAFRPSNGGAINKKEAEKLVEELKHLVVDNNYEGGIGVVKPFRAQASYIQNIIARDARLLDLLQHKNQFLVDTVHKFQGDERDIIYFSPVVSDGISEGALGFLASTGNLFNVAITRARSILVVVGNRSFCANCDVKYLENFAAYTISIENRPKDTAVKEYSKVYPVVANPEQVSDWERLLYSELYKRGILTIPQYSVDRYNLDLALIDNERKLDIEVDGEMYHRDWNGELCYRDQLRNHRLYELGWDVLRFWVYQIRDDMAWCIKQIENWQCKER